MSSTLPATAYIKMIDVWMIFTMLYPFAEIVLVWIKDFFKKRAVSKQGMYILKSRLLVGSHISNNVSLSVFFGAKLVEQCVREREKKLREAVAKLMPPGKLLQTWKLFVSPKDVNRFEATAKDMESFPKACASCQLFLSLQVSTSRIIKMQKEPTF